jgi:hypothetical protein
VFVMNSLKCRPKFGLNTTKTSAEKLQLYFCSRVAKTEV